MSQFYFNSIASHPSYPANAPSNNHHASRSRRTPRFNPSQTKPLKAMRSAKEPSGNTQATSFLKDFEAARSFELEDDELFCPWHLLTEDDVSTTCSANVLYNSLTVRKQLQSIHSSSSDRSSSSSGSPEASPQQLQLQPTPNFMNLPSMAHTQMASASFQQGVSGHLKLHQPLAQRTRNAIPIVDPNSRATSPPTSVSPARQAQKVYAGRRW